MSKQMYVALPPWLICSSKKRLAGPLLDHIVVNIRYLFFFKDISVAHNKNISRHRAVQDIVQAVIHIHIQIYFAML